MLLWRKMIFIQSFLGIEVWINVAVSILAVYGLVRLVGLLVTVARYREVELPRLAAAAATAAAATAASDGDSRRYRIAFCSDFCYPNMGGVEMHIYQLAQCLMRRGHKVIIITHAYGDRRGIRYLSQGLKTYYLNQRPYYNGNSLPTGGLGLFPVVRNILIRERIDVVHAHQAFSTIAHESLLFAHTMGLRSCFTDHSLFGFSDASAILMNKVLKFSLSNVSHVICVSHVSKENTCLRSLIDPSQVSVIPNAVDSTAFTPKALHAASGGGGAPVSDHHNGHHQRSVPAGGAVARPAPATPPNTRRRRKAASARGDGRQTVVVVSRLVYRKGIDLLVQCIPDVCSRYPNVDFLIAGDGPKRLALEEMRERYQLEERVTMLGSINHNEVRDVLIQGDIFLNCSLTETFCIAIVEAVSCGLTTVSTRVGGIPEVLPADMILLAEADPVDITKKVGLALERRRYVTRADEWAFHRRVSEMYNWDSVAERTERVYDRIMADPSDPTASLLERFQRVNRCGPFFGKIGCFTIAVMYLYYCTLE